jgi:peptidyl-dipeptidase Dcp
LNDNPLLETWTTPFGIAPLDRVRPEHFRDAFEHALAADRDEVAAVSGDPEPPTFENTIAALERSGRLLSRVSAVFYNLTGADTNEALRAIEREIAPVLSQHYNRIYLDDALFRRIDDLHRRRNELVLSAEEARVLERYHRVFRRHGAGLPDATRDRLAAISERLATLGTRFSQNVLADEQSFALALDTEEDLAGLPADLRGAARQAAAERGLPGHAITLSRSLIEPFLHLSTRRDLRERASRHGSRAARAAATPTTGQSRPRRSRSGPSAPASSASELRAFPHGRCHGETPDAVQDLLRSVWRPARALALREAADMQRLIDEEEGGFRLEAHDWRFYAEQVRARRFAYDAGEVKAYFPAGAGDRGGVRHGLAPLWARLQRA